MKPNRARQAAAEGRVAFGHMLMEFDTPGIAKLCALADLDFVLIDMEHGPLDLPQVAGIIARFKATGASPIVRVPASEYHFVARVMDAGAQGIMAPNVRTPEQARLLNDAMRYAPEGNRGLGLGTSHNDFVRPDPVDYMSRANRSNMLLCQIESTTALRNLDRIASEPGVDCLWVGHMDLTQSMGIVGQFHHPDFLAALRDVVAACREHGHLAGIQPGSPEQARDWMALGFDMISYSTDITIYGSALVSEVAAARGLVPKRD
ncbi:MAG: aldolase/citrate lyase family protein [Bryobacterales bacterium]|nr:aldolase/citrate lyase family protein [Bryobacterales bacterium]MDE0627083.1 aldolase/citrate lyase family protein [Bryobacterales bacterium]